MINNKEYSWLKLVSTPGFGEKSIYYVYTCIERAGLEISDLFTFQETELNALLPEIGKGRFSRSSIVALQKADNDAVYDQYQKLKGEGVHIIGLDDNRYPSVVKEKLQENAPPILFCKGNLSLLNARGISIVGSRDVSEIATLAAKRIAKRLAENGYNVTSGYAKGIDTAAHLGALENGGTTTMILSFGTNYISIKRDIKTYNWEPNSLFITQFRPFEKFSGQNAMIRNKLVCAMSRAVIVVCSGPEKGDEGKLSGTFDAGKSALDMGIPLFVISPDIFNPAPRGNFELIRLGGTSISDGTQLLMCLKETEKGNEKSTFQEQSKVSNTKSLQISRGSQLTINF